MKLTFENTITKQTLSLSFPAVDYILASADFGTVSSNDNSTQLVNLIGERVDSISLEPRPVSFSGSFLSKSKNDMDKKKRALKRLFNPLHEINVYHGDYVLTFKPDETVKDDPDWHKRTDDYYHFFITGTAYFPLWQLKSKKIMRKSEVQKVPMFPLAFPVGIGKPFGIVPAESIENVINTGDVPTGFIIRVKAEGGAVTNPKLINKLTGEFIEIRIEMQKGDTVEVSTVSGNKYATLKRGGTETDIFSYIPEASKLDMLLEVGQNNLEITAQGSETNMTSELVFTPGWMEVVV